MSTPTPLHYVAIGDSITVGIGSFLNHGYAIQYRRLLQRDLKRPITYENLAKNGWTSNDLLHELEHNRNFITSINKADIITCSIGGNDLLQANKDVRKSKDTNAMRKVYDGFHRNFILIDKTIKRIKKHKNKPYILRYIEIYNPRPDHHLAKKWIPRFNRVINQSEDPFTRVAKNYHAFEKHGKKLLFFDREHPNRMGHITIAQTLQQTGYDPILGTKK